MVPGAHQKEEPVLPGQPVEQPGQRAQSTIEEPISNADGQVDNTHLRCHRRLVPLLLEKPADGTMEEINDQRIFRNYFRSRLHPVMGSGAEDRAHIEATGACTFSRVKITMENKGGHRGSVPTFPCRILPLVAIGVIDYETACQTLMILQWKSIKEGHDRFTKRFKGRVRERRSCSFVFDDNATHLA
jgi:hypothetical protein